MRDKAIAEWKEKKIARAVFEFSCGGDSMNETNLVFKDENDEEVDVSGDLDAHIEGKLWNEVTFYECSDGHYMGEFGEVIIELDEDNFDEPTFTFDKQSKSEWEESLFAEVDITLTDEELEFCKSYVMNINGGGDGEAINYKADLILTEEKEELVKNLIEKIDSEVCNADYQENIDYEKSDWYTFTTDDENEGIDELQFNPNGTLKVFASQRFYLIKNENE